MCRTRTAGCLSTLARSAGLEIGPRGGILVDDQMRTSNPDIFAFGDAIEVKDFVTGEWSLVALAGPANRQGRIICRSGQRAYLATRILLQNGFKARNISGGMLSLAHNYLLGTDQEEGSPFFDCREPTVRKDTHAEILAGP